MAAMQFGRDPALDISVLNYGGSDIPANTAVLIDTTNVQSGDKNPGVVVPSSGGGVVGTLGITVETIKANAASAGRVAVVGVIQATADGSITAGGYVQASDTSTKMGRVKAKGAGLEQLGQALNTASDGQLVLVLLCKAATA
jgi:hypothetical protein